MRMPSSLLTAASAAAVLCAMASLGGVVEVAHGFAPPSPSSSSLSRAKTTATSPPAAVPRGTTVAVETLRRSHHRRDATAATAANTRLFMGWGPEPIWSLGTVTRNFPACPSGSCVSLFLDVEDGSGFVNPGQYVQVRPAGDDEAKPIFLAMASAPTGEAPKPVPPGKKKAAASEADAAAGPGTTTAVPIPATWEFLIKKTEFNSWITSIVPGSPLSVSQVMGSGFPISENVDGFKYDFPTQNLMLFATGSGIAPIRSAIESDRLGIGGGRTCTLYYGVRTPDDLSYVSKFPEWEGGGVSVVPVISRPDPLAGAAAWMGRTGYVQNALEEDGVPIPRNSAALLCGVNGMCDGVKAMLLDSGVFEGRVLKNF